MAVPHYAYLKMKMPGTKGIITISGDYEKSSACAAASSRLAESLVIAAEKKLLERVVAMAGKQPDMSPEPKESETQGSLKPAKETKKIPLDPEHPERHTVRCMQKFLLKQLGRNARVYVDDIVVKTEKRGTLLEDLKETFENLRRFQIKLNPEKCVFGVPAGQLLGFLVSKRGIECNCEDQGHREDGETHPTERRPEVYRLFGIHQPFHQSARREGSSLYQLVKKTTHFEWNDKADEAFLQLKKMYSTPPVLAASTAKEPMYLYIAATSRNYPHYQKMCYSVHFAAKKLKPYFQEHPIMVVCTAPLAEIIGNRDASGGVAKWAIELPPTPSSTSRALPSSPKHWPTSDWAETQYLPPAPDSTHWRMHFDGSKMRTGLGAGVVLTSPKGDKLRYTLQIHFAASNNVAEYEALIHDLWLAKEIGIRRILCYGDSDLVVQ
ncbi:unnamed protein product [Triticum aestivum]|uniref:RNase H type-1 domain-containing protein n=1 Tax=Triticum aestivum TaxID=4565 RepID=A0A7H4LEQ4_WHEAT|nr:unnamed protein product [Triticum aestivum]